MIRRRKLLHIWPIEYSGDGSRGLQTLSPEKYSLYLDTGSFSVSKTKLLVWTPGQEWVRGHKVYELTLCTITKLYIVFTLKKPHRSKNDILSFWKYTCIIGIMRDKWLLGWEHFSDASYSPCFHSKLQKFRSHNCIPVWSAAIAVLSREILLFQFREKTDANFQLHVVICF